MLVVRTDVLYTTQLFLNTLKNGQLFLKLLHACTLSDYDTYVTKEKCSPAAFERCHAFRCTCTLCAAALVKDQLDTHKEYDLEWADGRRSRQRSCFIFGAFTKKHPLAIGDHVLAVANEKSLTYLPGRIVRATNSRTTLQVDFCNGKT